MTIEEKLRKMLVELAMSSDQADRVIRKTKELESNKPMAERWQHDLEGYPPQFLDVLWLSVQEMALQDIDTHTPEAFYRSLFV